MSYDTHMAAMSKSSKKQPSCSDLSCGRSQGESEEMTRIAASITRYYDSLTDEEIAEDRAWGLFAETQFPLEDDRCAQEILQLS
jgi:hypothetical protein